MQTVPKYILVKYYSGSCLVIANGKQGLISLASKTFGVDNDANIYVVRASRAKGVILNLPKLLFSLCF